METEPTFPAAMLEGDFTALDVLKNVSEVKKNTSYHRNAAEYAKLKADLHYVSTHHKDYVYPSAALRAMPDDETGFKIAMLQQGTNGIEIAQELTPTRWARRQIAEKCAIPIPYFERMLQQGQSELACHNINTWLPDKSKRMLKTLDGTLRAFLSPRYLTIDNFKVLDVVDKAVQDSGAVVQRLDISDVGFYIKAINLDKGVAVGQLADGSDDIHNIGIVVSNSDVGGAAFDVEPFLWRQACANGMIGVSKFRRVHLGQELEVGTFTQETVNHSAESIFMQARDTINATLLTGTIFEEMCASLRAAKSSKLEDLIPKGVALTDFLVNATMGLGLREDEAELVEQAWVDDPTLSYDDRRTIFGWGQAITTTANSIKDTERALDIQRIGGALIREDPMKLKALYSTKRRK